MKSLARISFLILYALTQEVFCEAGDAVSKTTVDTVLVVLGNQPLDDHTPTVDMIARVNKAVEFHKANLGTVLVFTGGPTAGVVSEARMMADLAIASGVSSNAVRLEENARSTSE